MVILSPSFFAKEWPQRELDGLTAKETQSGEKVILPIWHEVDTETVTQHSPALADKLRLPSEMGAEGLADELERGLLAGGEAIGGAPPPARPIDRRGLGVGMRRAARIPDRDLGAPAPEGRHAWRRRCVIDIASRVPSA